MNTNTPLQELIARRREMMQQVRDYDAAIKTLQRESLSKPAEEDVVVAQNPTTKRRGTRKGEVRRITSPMGLAIIKVMKRSSSPMTVRDIVAAIINDGFKFKEGTDRDDHYRATYSFLASHVSNGRFNWKGGMYSLTGNHAA